MHPKADISTALLEGIGLKLILSLLFVVTGLALGRLKEKLPGRRLWRISDPSRVVISVAHSVDSDTGEYRRPATGIGQVQALALLMPSLRRTYSNLKVSNIYLSSEPLQERLEDDLICLGSAKNNRVTADVIDRLGTRCPVSMNGSQFIWREGSGPDEVHEGVIENDKVVSDVGLILCTENPFKPGRVVIVLAGSHTYGTTAAARFFCEELSSPFRRLPRSFAILVEARVHDGFPSSPKQIRRMQLPR